MALDYSGLTQAPTFGQSFMAGRQAAQEQAERNLLRQAQMEQMQAQRENMLAQRQEREALATQRTQETARKAADAERRRVFLSGLNAQLQQNGYRLDRPTLGQILSEGMQTGEERLVKLATEGIRALDDEERDVAELARIQGGAPAARMPGAPAAPVTAPAGELLAGTPFATGMNALAARPAPPEAVAAPAPTEPMVGGFTRGQIEQMVASTSPRIKARGEALAKLLPKDQQPRLQDRFVPVGRLVFDRETQQFITPPAAAIAATQDRGAGAAAAPKAPPGYRFTAAGELEPIPGGPAAPKPMSPVQEAARRDKIGKEFKAAQTALQTTQDVLDSVSFVRNEPGLTRALGFTGMLPSFPGGQAASADVRLENLKGKVTALGKAAAAATGAIGQIANQEWKILADQIAIVDKIKGMGPLMAQLDLIDAQAKGAMERIRDAYQRQFGEDFTRFPQFSELPAPKSVAPRREAQGQAAPAPGAGPRAAPAAPAAAPLTPAEQAELDALRQRFGRPPQ